MNRFGLWSMMEGSRMLKNVIQVGWRDAAGVVTGTILCKQPIIYAYTCLVIGRIRWICFQNFIKLRKHVGCTCLYILFTCLYIYYSYTLTNATCPNNKMCSRVCSSVFFSLRMHMFKHRACSEECVEYFSINNQSIWGKDVLTARARMAVAMSSCMMYGIFFFH